MRIFYFLTWVTRFYAYILYAFKIYALNYMYVMYPIKLN